MFEIDFQGRTLTVRTQGGAVTTVPLPAGSFEFDTNIERLSVSDDLGDVVVSLPGGQDAHVELRGNALSIDELRAGRPTIYLDQNHWSTIAAARSGLRDVSAEDARASERLDEMVQARELLIPVSGGNLVETTPLHGVRRTALATASLQLSRGWQMRNPLHVRVDEMLRAVCGSSPEAPDVFAPQADELFGSSTSSPRSVDEQNPLQYLNRALPSILGIYDVLVDTEAIRDEGGVAETAAAAWAANWAKLALMLHAAGEPAQMVRRVAHANLILDARDDVHRVARIAKTTPEAVIESLTGSEDPVARMPFLAQMRQLLFARLRNVTQTWEANDLVDSCS